MQNNYLFTSESVTEGHPDKMADQISDAILDAILTLDPMARVACETIVNTGLVVIFGEITTEAYIDIQSIVRQTIREIGYTDRKYGFDADNVAVLVTIDEQSPDIAQGVNDALETRNSDGEQTLIGAGDQGIMFGYATNETAELMPLAISLSHQLAKQLAKVRKDGTLVYLGPDGKTQVTIEYDKNGQPQKIDNLVISAQHDEAIELNQIYDDIIHYVVKPVIPNHLIDQQTEYFINPTGKFVIGGPVGDSGLTGRKIIVDTYGGTAHHGGGAFSGKDATKVDRSASYAARYIAKNIVASGVADKCEIQLAYAIGVSEPTSIKIDTFSTSQFPSKKIEEVIRKVFSLTPSGIIDMLDLRQPIYKQTAAYGHFGRPDLDLPWEKIDKVNDIKHMLEI